MRSEELPSRLDDDNKLFLLLYITITQDVINLDKGLCTLGPTPY